MLRVTMTPWSAPRSTPPFSSGPWPLTPTGPQIPYGGGPRRLGRPVTRAPQVMRVAAGHLPPPGGWTVARAWTGLRAISSLERLENVIKKSLV